MFTAPTAKNALPFNVDPARARPSFYTPLFQIGDANLPIHRIAMAGSGIAQYARAGLSRHNDSRTADRLPKTSD